MTIGRSITRVAAAVLLTSFSAGFASAMSFRTVSFDGGLAYVAVGTITLETPGEFASLPAGPGTVVMLNSPGGNVGASVALGSLFRNRGITAMVAGITRDGRRVAGACYSACVYALVGASHRVVPSRSRVGIHRMAPADDGYAMSAAYERAEHRAAAATLKGYTASMGVDPSLIVSAERTPNSTIHVLSPRELSRYGVIDGR